MFEYLKPTLLGFLTETSTSRVTFKSTLSFAISKLTSKSRSFNEFTVVTGCLALKTVNARMTISNTIAMKTVVTMRTPFLPLPAPAFILPINLINFIFI